MFPFISVKKFKGQAISIPEDKVDIRLVFIFISLCSLYSSQTESSSLSSFSLSPLSLSPLKLSPHSISVLCKMPRVYSSQLSHLAHNVFLIFLSPLSTWYPALQNKLKSMKSHLNMQKCNKQWISCSCVLYVDRTWEYLF